MKLRSLSQLRLSSYFLVFIFGLGLSLMLSGCGGGSGNSGGSGGNKTPTPAVSSISPTSVNAGSSDLTLTVVGSGFESSSAVQVGGVKESTTYVSATQLKATVPAAQMASGADLAVSVLDGSVSSTNSPAINLEVDNPSPWIATILPGAEPTGAASPVLTFTGGGFVPTTVIDVNGSARTTTYTSTTQVSAALTAADVAAVGTLSVTAVNSTPGGGTAVPVLFPVVAPTPTPVITSVSPNSFVIGSPDSSFTVYGANFTQSSVVLWNGTPLPTGWGYYNSGSVLYASVPAADLAATGTATVTVSSPTATPALSNGSPITITNPPAPTITSMYPSGGPIDVAASVTIAGTGFTPNSTVSVNGQQIASTYQSSAQISVAIPASSLALPGNYNVTVSTPAPGGGTSSPLPYTTFVSIADNDIVYNATDGLLYASVPVASDGVAGNSIAGIDPNTGNVMRQIWVGSNPNKLALSTDGTQLFVGLDGAGAVAQINLATGKVVKQFSLNDSVSNGAPYKAGSLAAVPGLPNSVAVLVAGGYSSGLEVTIYDSGVARPNSSTTGGTGALAFGSSASTLYSAYANTVYQLTIDSTGVTASTTLYNGSNGIYTLQYDNGSLYLSTGAVISASTGSLLGTLYASTNSAASGPIVSDSTLGRAFAAESSYSGTGDVYGFDETSFNQIGMIPVADVISGGYPSSFEKIVRWGQTGVALNTSAQTSNNSSGQIFIFQSPLVKNVSSTPADLSVALSAPATATTGAAISWAATVKNSGPNPAEGASLALTLDPSLIVNSITPSQGSCGSGTAFACDLGTLASGASATVTVHATPTTAGTLAGVASVTSGSYDPTTTNNQSTTSTTVTGSLYAAVPVLSSILPNLVQAGTSDFTLTVNGAGFNDSSVVNLGATALTTTYVSATQLTAAVTAAQIANYGWASVTVSNAAPGGGVSQVLPLTIYDLVNVPVSAMLVDPYTQSIYATVPSTATSITGNSVVAINPATGVVGTPVAVGSQPTVMAETDDGNYLYVGLGGADNLVQFNLSQHAVTATIPLTVTQNSTTSPVMATSLAAMPGSDTTLAIGTTNVWSTFGIFDVTGATGAFRTNFSGYYDGTNPLFANTALLYASQAGGEFYRYAVDANGVTLTDGTALNDLGNLAGGLQLANGLIYGYGGGIANPSTTPPSQIATLVTPTMAISSYATFADPSLRKEFMMAYLDTGNQGDGLIRFDLNTYLPEATLNLPSSYNSSVWTMLRWGQDGLAALSSVAQYNSSNQLVTTTQLMLLRGPFVVPQELQTSTAASLTSSSASTIAHGTGNTMLTLTGSHFLPGVAVTWNGSYRTTTIVDATHVSVAIPASDLASAGTASLVATNPGASASSALQITIN